MGPEGTVGGMFHLYMIVFNVGGTMLSSVVLIIVCRNLTAFFPLNR